MKKLKEQAKGTRSKAKGTKSNGTRLKKLKRQDQKKLKGQDLKS